MVVVISGKMLEQSLPNRSLGPMAEPPVGVFPVTQALRQVAPGNAGTVAVENRFDKAAVVVGGDADMAGSPPATSP